MKKLGIILSLVLFCLPICLLGSCEQVEIDENIKSIEIYRETTQIEELIITEGDTVELFAFVDGTPTYTFDTIVDLWESSDEAIATVKDGTIKGVKNLFFKLYVKLCIGDKAVGEGVIDTVSAEWKKYSLSTNGI